MAWVLGEAIRITVPGTPRPLEKHGTRLVTPKGRAPFVMAYTPARSRDHMNQVKDLAYRVMGNRPPIDQEVELKFVAFMPIPASWSQKKQRAALADQIRPTARPDLSNLIKLTEDGMNKIVFRDDSLITDAHLFKRFSERPRLVIQITLLTWQNELQAPVGLFGDAPSDPTHHGDGHRVS